MLASSRTQLLLMVEAALASKIVCLNENEIMEDVKICHFNNFISFSYTSILSIGISCLQKAARVADSNRRHRVRRETATVLPSVTQQRSTVDQSLRDRSVVQNAHHVRLCRLFPEFSPVALRGILGNYMHM